MNNITYDILYYSFNKTICMVINTNNKIINNLKNNKYYYVYRFENINFITLGSNIRYN